MQKNDDSNRNSNILQQICIFLLTIRRYGCIMNYPPKIRLRRKFIFYFKHINTEVMRT